MLLFACPDQVLRIPVSNKADEKKIQDQGRPLLTLPTESSAGASSSLMRPNSKHP